MKPWWFGASGIGFAAATVGAFIGIGGGIVLTPLQLLLYDLRGIHSHHLVQHIFATNMMYMLIVSSMTAWRYHKIYTIRLGRIKTLLAGAFFGALTGGYFAAILPGNVLKGIFAVVLIISSIRFFVGDGINGYLRFGSNGNTELAGFFGGYLAGGIAPLAGVGGGIVMIPVLSFLYKTPVKEVPAYSHTAIVLIAAVSLINYIWQGWGMHFADHNLGFVNLDLAGLMIIGAIPGIWTGTWLNQKLSTVVTKRIVGGFIFAVAIYVTFFK